MQPLIWVVVPCYREQQLLWVVGLFTAQTYPNRKLCVVENGDAIGACRRLSIPADLVVTSRQHVSHARNEGMYAIREQPGDGWISMWDDDDWYGPGYLEEVADLIWGETAEVYGKHRHFVAMPDRGLLLFNERNQNKYTEYVHGPTLVFRADDGVNFRVQKEAEEVRWCNDMRRLGARVWASSIHHLLYLRYSAAHGHAWVARPDNVVSASKRNDYYYSLGAVDTAVVTGDVPWRTRVVRTDGRRVSAPIAFPGKSASVRILPGTSVRKPVWAGFNSSGV